MKVSAIMHDSFDLTVFRSSFVVHRDGLIFLDGKLQVEFEQP